MKKLILVLSICIFILAACGPAEKTPTPVPTVDQTKMVNPAIGWVLVNERPGADLAYVFASPDFQAATVGSVPIGAIGTIDGFNEKGDWVLVKFEDLGVNGWMPIAVLTLTYDY